MARPKDGTFRQLCGEIDPRKVAEIVDGYGLGIARERWHWAYAFIHAIAQEGRRMKVAGETWRRVPRPAGPEVEEVEAPPARPPRPMPAPRLVERQSAPAPRATPIVPAEVDQVADLLRRLASHEHLIEEMAARLARLEARQTATSPWVVPIRPAPAPAWDFPVEPDALLRMLRRWSVRMVALT
ncbi:hypothetical protein MKK69_09225 [Methylobacterium sp. J-026]|jgi:hypothetical protein|uniref:hypothetical protein n=1 Tax=unclassified Methylobacterium TaxID=2615210 RepID=UPI0011CCB0DB|nr:MULTISPECIES: hypothetical protein [unclassified Methylobacterium]MCJ2134233.1 hypothetical protein [Methylobacterium sp. J-026]TXM71180.1 hypothetical protein FV229_00445 [Methylobacterium sp. WL120]